jgi:hypothetical protein
MTAPIDRKEQVGSTTNLELALPDPRIVEDLIEAGRRALLRAARDHEPDRQKIEAAANWLIERSRELRQP